LRACDHGIAVGGEFVPLPCDLVALADLYTTVGTSSAAVMRPYGALSISRLGGTEVRRPGRQSGTQDSAQPVADETVQSALFRSPTAFPLDVEHGSPSTQFTLHLKGVGWTETANIYTVVYDNSYVGYACAFNSHGDVEIPLQATGDPGWHFIDLYPAIYRGEEQQPRNFLSRS
jgi:hypothetical protein